MYQAGGVIGSIIPICLNWKSTAGTVSDATVSDQSHRMFMAKLTEYLTVYHFHLNNAMRLSTSRITVAVRQSYTIRRHSRRSS